MKLEIIRWLIGVAIGSFVAGFVVWRILTGFIDQQIKAAVSPDGIVAQKYDKQLQETEGKLGDINEQLSTFKLPDQAILISTVECSKLEGNWKDYSDLSGRFALAKGASTDEYGETKQYALGDKHGVHDHKLEEDELPEHAHKLIWGLDTGDTGKRVRGYNLFPENKVLIGRTLHDTSSIGGNKPHNNMPPYLVLSYCIQNR